MDPSTAPKTISPALLHTLILKSFEGRDRAYAPYSKFHVGAAILFDDDVIVTGCNVENASYGAGICAERTAMTKAISEGLTRPLAVIVTSHLPTPTISPCGICRQFLREFAPLTIPIYMIAAGYPRESATAPSWLSGWSGEPLLQEQDEGGEQGKNVKVMTMGELLPMSFGPQHLEMGR